MVLLIWGSLLLSSLWLLLFSFRFDSFRVHLLLRHCFGRPKAGLSAVRLCMGCLNGWLAGTAILCPNLAWMCAGSGSGATTEAAYFAVVTAATGNDSLWQATWPPAACVFSGLTETQPSLLPDLNDVVVDYDDHHHQNSDWSYDSRRRWPPLQIIPIDNVN